MEENVSASTQDISSPAIDDRPLAASYVRCALADPEGAARQMSQNERQASADGFCIPDDADHRFTDDGASGANTEREGFKRLMTMIATAGAPFTRLYVTDRARLGRWNDPTLHTVWECLCEYHGVAIRYGSDGAAELSRDYAGRQIFLAALGRAKAHQKRSLQT